MGVPFKQYFAGLDLLTFFDQDGCTIRNFKLLKLSPLFIKYRHFAISLKRYYPAFAVILRKRHSIYVTILNDTCYRSILLSFKNCSRSNTAGMECTKCQLSAWFTNGLGCDNTNRHTFFHEPAFTHIPSVAFGANTIRTIAGQRTSHSYRIKTQSLDLCCCFRGNYLVFINNHLIGDRIADIIPGRSAYYKFRKRHLNLFTCITYTLGYSLKRAAVMFHYNYVLCDIDKLSSKITRIRCLQRRISQPFSCPVGRTEVLQNSHSFTEIRLNRRLDNLTAGLGHQCSHTCKLLNLVHTAPGAGITHQIYRVQMRRAVIIFVLTQTLHHFIGNRHTGMSPRINHLVITFSLGQNTCMIVLEYLRYLLFSIVYNLLFLLGYF